MKTFYFIQQKTPMPLHIQVVNAKYSNNEQASGPLNANDCMCMLQLDVAVVHMYPCGERMP